MIDLDRLAELEAKATQGPWDVARDPEGWRLTSPLCSVAQVFKCYQREANADLITSLRNHAPALIAAARVVHALAQHLGVAPEQVTAEGVVGCVKALEDALQPGVFGPWSSAAAKGEQ